MWEFECAMRGYHRRIETERALLAWHAAYVMAPHLKKRDRPKAKDLLGSSTLAGAKRKRKQNRKKKSVTDGE